MSPGSVCQAGDRLLQFFGDHPRLGLAGIGQHRDEAIPCQAAQQILPAQIEHQQLRDGLQHCIAFVLAITSVDGIEVVQVHGDERQRLLHLAGFCQRALNLLAQVFGGAQRRHLVEQAMFAKQPFAFAHLLADGALLLIEVIDAEREQQQADGHRRRLQPVVPGDRLRQLDELVQGIHPPGEEDAGEPERQQPGHPARRSAVQQHDQPDQRQHGRAAFAGDIHPVDLRPAFQLAGGEVELQAEVGGDGEAHQGPGVQSEEGFHRFRASRQLKPAPKQIGVTVRLRASGVNSAQLDCVLQGSF